MNRISVVSDMLRSLESVPITDVERADSLVSASAIIELLLYIIIGIIWLVWFRRCYDNIAATRRRLVHSGGWAVGSWFVPFLNLIRPKQIADDMFRATSPAAHVPGFVHLWWGLFVAGSYLGRGTRFGDDSLSGIRTGDWIGVVADALTIFAALAAIAVVRSLTSATSNAIQPPPPVTYETYKS